MGQFLSVPPRLGAQVTWTRSQSFDPHVFWTQSRAGRPASFQKHRQTNSTEHRQESKHQHGQYGFDQVEPLKDEADLSYQAIFNT